jgi:hypothetical protein
VGQVLERRRHPGQQRRVAKALGQDQVSDSIAGRQGRQIGQGRPSFEERAIAALEVVRDPGTGERALALVEPAAVLVEQIARALAGLPVGDGRQVDPEVDHQGA